MILELDKELAELFRKAMIDTGFDEKTLLEKMMANLIIHKFIEFSVPELDTVVKGRVFKHPLLIWSAMNQLIYDLEYFKPDDGSDMDSTYADVIAGLWSVFELYRPVIEPKKHL